MSYSVSERTHEIGIRMSQGAQTRDIVSLVLRGGMFMTLLGLAIGLPIAFLLARTMSALLFNVTGGGPDCLHCVAVAAGGGFGAGVLSACATGGADWIRCGRCGTSENPVSRECLAMAQRAYLS